MAYAYKELLHTDHTISSIALDNGFASSRAFSREFVKRYGILPGRVERQNHKNVKKVLCMSQEKRRKAYHDVVCFFQFKTKIQRSCETVIL